jgi:hypothetical protein
MFCQKQNVLKNILCSKKCWFCSTHNAPCHVDRKMSVRTVAYNVEDMFCKMIMGRTCRIIQYDFRVETKYHFQC